MGFQRKQSGFTNETTFKKLRLDSLKLPIFGDFKYQLPFTFLSKIYNCEGLKPPFGSFSGLN